MKYALSDFLNTFVPIPLDHILGAGGLQELILENPVLLECKSSTEEIRGIELKNSISSH